MKHDKKGRFVKGSKNPNLILPKLGKRFGKLEVISEKYYFNSDNRPVWTLKCDCGEIQEIKAKDLRREKNPRDACSKCLRKTAGVERMKILGRTKKPGSHSGVGDITKTHYFAYKSSSIANRRKSKNQKIFDGKYPSIEFLWSLYEKQNGRCALSGVKIKFGKLIRTPKKNVTKKSNDWQQSRINSKENTASLDRIDSSIGYTNDNAQWVHKKVNFMKGSLDQDDFIELCSLIANYDNHEPSLVKKEGATTIS